MGISMSVIPASPVWGIVAGLVIIALMVLILPFRVKIIEHNLEVFFLLMGVLAVTISGGWSIGLIIDALKAPVIIGSLPIGIFQIVLIFGLLIFFFNKQFSGSILAMANKFSIGIFVFFLILVLGLLSSVISVIVTSVILAEIVAALPLKQKDRVKLVVVTCFAVGLGAILTPLGEPMSTILVQKLSAAPYYAGFTFPIQHFAIFVVPGCIAFALFGAIWIGRTVGLGKPAIKMQAIPTDDPPDMVSTETVTTVILRAVKVFAFVAALVLLGEGLKPLIIWFFTKIPAVALYWINMVSAILDNATLTAVEINVSMSMSQVTAVCMGLLIAGGMLIPGNIPNIVAAGRLKISMREWAVYGLPIGLIVLAIYFGVLMMMVF